MIFSIEPRRFLAALLSVPAVPIMRGSRARAINYKRQVRVYILQRQVMKWDNNKR